MELIKNSKLGFKKGTWSPEEDQMLIAYIKRYGIWNWTLMPKAAGLSRTGKSCRLRWMNYLRPNLKRERFSVQEIEMMVKLHESIGNRWSKIAEKLPGRTDNEIKNFWNTHMRRRFTSSSNCGGGATLSLPENHQGRLRKGIKQKPKRAAVEKGKRSSSLLIENAKASTRIHPEFAIAESYTPISSENSSSTVSLESYRSSSSKTSSETHYFSSASQTQEENSSDLSASDSMEEAIRDVDAQMNDEEPDWALLAHELSSTQQHTCDSINNRGALLSFWFNVFVQAHEIEEPFGNP